MWVAFREYLAVWYVNKMKNGTKVPKTDKHETTERALCSLAGCFNQIVFLLCLHICTQKHYLTVVLLWHLESRTYNKVSIVLNSVHS